MERRDQEIAYIDIYYDGGGASSEPKRTTTTLSGLQTTARKNGVSDLYKAAKKHLTPLFDRIGPMASTLAFDGRVQKRVVAILRLYPGDSNADQGLRFSVYFTRLADYFGVRNPNVRRVRSAFPPVEDLYDSRAKTDRSDGYFRSEEEILRVANVLADQRE